MTTSPITITAELLDELQRKAKAVIEENTHYGDAEFYGPALGSTSAVEREYVCATSPATILALVEHIRSLEAAQAEREVPEVVAVGAWRKSTQRYHVVDPRADYMERVYGASSNDGGVDFELHQLITLADHQRIAHSLAKRLEKRQEFLLHIKKCLQKNGEYAPLSHQELDELLGIGPYSIAQEGAENE